MSYNGWSNRETWLIHLHFGDTLQEVASDILDDEFRHSVDEPINAHDLADMLEEWMDEIAQPVIDRLPTWLSDLVYYSQVDWYDLALTYIGEWEIDQNRG